MTPIEPWKPLVLPLRSAAIYAAVIDSLQVESNPRYQPRDGKTFCNIFVWDVTRAMGCEVPHWVDSIGRVSLPSTGALELTANDMAEFLQYGRDGWRACLDHGDAQLRANEGLPTIAAWKNPNGPGHIAMVRPAPAAGDSTSGPWIAQAGSHNYAIETLYVGFGARPVEFFWHP